MSAGISSFYVVFRFLILPGSFSRRLANTKAPIFHFFELTGQRPNFQSAGADHVFRLPSRCYSENHPNVLSPPKSDMLSRLKPGQAGSLRACAFPPTFAHFPTPKICHRLGSWIQIDPQSCPVGQSEFSLQ